MEKELTGLLVYKFGGASVKDAAAIRNLRQVVETTAQGRPLLIVVSAMGKSTNALEEIFGLAYTGGDYMAPLARLEAYHQEAAQLLATYLKPNTQADIQEMLGEVFSTLR